MKKIDNYFKILVCTLHGMLRVYVEVNDERSLGILAGTISSKTVKNLNITR